MIRRKVWVGTIVHWQHREVEAVVAARSIRQVMDATRLPHGQTKATFARTRDPALRRVAMSEPGTVFVCHEGRWVPS